MKKLVVFDIDGVLAEFEPRLVETLESEFGIYARTNRHMYSIEDRFRNFPDILKRALELTNDPNFYYAIESNDEACQLVASLAGDGYGVLYLSSRPKSAENFTRRWLQSNTWEYSRSMGMFVGVEDKAEFLADVVVEFVVEDSPEQIEKLKDAGIPVLCWDKQWNEGIFPRLFTDRNGHVFLWEEESLESIPFLEVEGA